MKTTSFQIRPEEPGDIAAITELVDTAFKGMPYAQGDEAALVTELRRLHVLPVTLVAVKLGKIVGHIAFSPASATDGSTGWYALGPIAVLPEYQGVGIGSMLLDAGLSAIAEKGAMGCILVGHPRLYLRAGFKNAPENTPSDEPPEYFMVKQFWGNAPRGPINFHPAFKNAA
jgi:putative acetyltransferase